MKAWYVVNAYTARNAGDAAITLGTALVAAEADGAGIHVATRYHHRDAAFYRGHGISCGPPPVAFPIRGTRRGLGAWRLVVLMVSFVTGLILAIAYRVSPRLARPFLRGEANRGLKEMLAADRVVIAGGGYLYSSRRRFNLTLLHCLACMLLPMVAGLHPVMMPQSVGPAGRFDRTLIGMVLRKLGRVTVRERRSFEFVRDALHVRKVAICPDAAFALDGDLPHPEQVFAAGTTVGVAPMDWSWSRATSAEALPRYTRKMAVVVRELNRAGHAVRLLASSRVDEQDQDDLAIGREIAAQAIRSGATDVALVETRTVDEFIAALLGVNVVVGTRLHACILAIAHGRAAVAIGYQPKTAGTYELLELRDYVHDVETFDPGRIAAQVDALIREPSRVTPFEHARIRARERLLTYYGELCRNDRP